MSAAAPSVHSLSPAPQARGASRRDDSEGCTAQHRPRHQPCAGHFSASPTPGATHWGLGNFLHLALVNDESSDSIGDDINKRNVKEASANNSAMAIRGGQRRSRRAAVERHNDSRHDSSCWRHTCGLVPPGLPWGYSRKKTKRSVQAMRGLLQVRSMSADRLGCGKSPTVTMD